MPRISEIVLQEVPDAQFVLGGVGELEKLEKLVNMNHFKFLGWIEGEEKKEWLECWVSVKQFSKNDKATACQDWLRSTRLGRGSIKSHVRTVKVLGMGLFAFQERIHLWKGVTH